VAPAISGGSFEEARALAKTSSSFEGHSRVLPDMSAAAFLPKSDKRGVVRVSVNAGNDSVAHYMRSGPGPTHEVHNASAEVDGAWWPQGSSSPYFEQLSMEDAPGRYVLKLRAVCWLDIRSRFCDLPPTTFTFSMHVNFPTSSNFYRVATPVKDINISIDFEDKQGNTTRTIECGKPFFPAIVNQVLHNSWLRFDISGVGVLPGDYLTRIRVHHTANVWKENILFGRLDAIPNAISKPTVTETKQAVYRAPLHLASSLSLSPEAISPLPSATLVRTDIVDGLDDAGLDRVIATYISE
jgi:hypothetical protein